MKPIAVAVGILAVMFRFYIGNYDQADAKLEAFYKETLSADFSAARKSIDEAINLWPSNARYYGWRGYNLSQKLPSQCLHAMNGTGAVLKAEDQSAIRLAIQDYRRALELNSRDGVDRHNLGWLEHLQGDDTDAAMDWEAAIAIDPDNAVFHLSYGMFLEESGNVRPARDEIEAAIELSPSILDSPFFTRYRNLNQEAADSVVAHCVTKLENKLGRTRDPILEARLGKLYQYPHNWVHSAELLQDAAKQLPNLALVWFNLGEAYRVQGDDTQAMDCYKKANVVNGSLAGPYLRMGELYLRSGQKELAIHNFRLAAGKWEHVNPITAAHNNRLYNGPRQQIDDLLPTTLVWYSTPCEASAAYRGLAQLLPGVAEYASRINTCDEIPAPHPGQRENR